MFDLIDIVKANCPNQYKIVEKTTCARELYFVGRKVETVRATETSDAQVTVYVNNADGTLGDSTFPVYASMDEADVVAALQKAVARAKLVHNQPYELEQGGVASYHIESSIAEADAGAIAEKVADAVWQAKMPAGGSINALEIFVGSETKRVRLSTGLDKTQTSYYIAIEAIPTHTDDKESVELYEWYESNDVDYSAITAEIESKMREVRDRHEASKGEPQVIDVALRADEIRDVLNELTWELSYSRKYMHANAFEVGHDFQENRVGDALTVTMTNQIKGSRASAAFDSDGVSLTPRTVIEDGKAVAMWGSSRFGQYLGQKDVTGALGCISLAPGSVHCLEGRYLECVSMSNIQLDIYNDYIGGEIRLAYLHEGDRVTPITGISMSGQLSKVLPSLLLSDDKVVRGAYEGPSLMLLKDIQIV